MADGAAYMAGAGLYRAGEYARNRLRGFGFDIFGYVVTPRDCTDLVVKERRIGREHFRHER